MVKRRAGLLFAALVMGGCVGGSPAGSLMGIAAGFDPTGLSGMVAGQMMAAEAQAAAEQQQAQAQAMLQTYVQAGLLGPDPSGMTGAMPLAAAASSSAEQAAIASLAAAPIGTSITWTDAATGERGRATVRSIEQEMGGQSCRHITRAIERATGPMAAETSICTGDAIDAG